MRGGFKAQVKRDIKAVFNSDCEHADKVPVRYNGKNYKIPVIFDSDGEKDRKIVIADHVGGIFISYLTVFISRYDLAVMPRKETTIEIDGDEYHIVNVGHEAGEIRLDLEMFDE